ncbi:thymidine kinase [Mycoplasmopsis verecunda]|uniref:Thymidine kinase n=1 Tax=Mycoplasmopsis verecunda TaxID=171291 RepID=A0A1T4KML9_9BACT|nr:thymidine kinase [Mycoplasmopsis verecunda]WPB54300.1 thymidine kinase [Mycoplasmopsis verecunda]SJZ43645.1 thymidine kinase [Mycoplasmopsis verecunda]
MFWKLKQGYLSVITGPMFAGKSAELIKRLTTLKIAKVKFVVFKPEYDVRFSSDEIVSRTGSRLECIKIKSPQDIWKHIDFGVKAVAFDEVHFFDENIVDHIQELLNRGIKVIVSGLDMDFRGKSFNTTGKLLALADEITKLKAVCVKCYGQANMSYRKVKSEQLHLLGDAEYEARCRICHQKDSNKTK